MAVYVPDELRQIIKDNNPLKELMEEMYGKTIVNGNKTVCDFHDDSDPSMHLFPDGGYKCFVCGAGKFGQTLTMPDGETWTDQGNDVLGWLCNKERIPQMEGWKILAERAGIQLPEKHVNPELENFKNKVTEQNRKFYQALMADEDALNYLYNRGIGADEIAHWRIGMVPWDWENKRYAGRIVFGMKELTWDPKTARTIAFAYRVREERDYLKHGFDINDEKRRAYLMNGKYVNDAKSIVYDKKSYLYGLTESIATIRKAKCAVIMEGYADVIAAHKSGLTNAVACCSASVTEEQAALLARYTKRVFLWLDGDRAGIAGMRRSLPNLLKHGLEVMIVLSYGKDPDELVREGIDLQHYLIANNQHAVQYVINDIMAEHDRVMNSARIRAMNEMIPLLQSVHNPIHQANFKAVMENRLGVQLQI